MPARTPIELEAFAVRIYPPEDGGQPGNDRNASARAAYKRGYQDALFDTSTSRETPQMCTSTYAVFPAHPVLAELYVCEREAGHPFEHQDRTRRKAWDNPVEGPRD